MQSSPPTSLGPDIDVWQMTVLSFIKKIFNTRPAGGGKVALQPPGVPFPWPRGVRLTALERLTIAIPAAAVGDGEKIGSVIHASANMELGLPQKPSDTLIYLRFETGMAATLSKSVQGVVIADDKVAKRIQIENLPNHPSPPSPASRAAS